MRLFLFAALLALGACQSVTITGNGNTVSQMQTTNGALTIPASALP